MSISLSTIPDRGNLPPLNPQAGLSPPSPMYTSYAYIHHPLPLEPQYRFPPSPHTLHPLGSPQATELFRRAAAANGFRDARMQAMMEEAYRKGKKRTKSLTRKTSSTKKKRPAKKAPKKATSRTTKKKSKSTKKM
tara:strand:+ start:1107 stop:1511 length:405 start_codon:yes stop_codon:yes gene_type:complete